jgi:hypothetical protein
MLVARSPGTRFARALRAMLGGAAALLMGCHSTTFTPGTVVVSMGNANPDPQFASYLVAIDSITLTDNNGNVVALLSTPETVDLAQLNSMTELVEAPAVPSATYTSASFVIDYSAATIWVNDNGKILPATVAAPGNIALTAETVTVTFDPQHPLVVTNGVSGRVVVDVDLTASNSVDTSTSPATVTAQPFVVMTAAPEDATVFRSRGLFVTTQTVTSGFYMNTRPFYDLVSALGALIVNTSAQTYFNINGVAYVGAPGLAQLAVQPESTPIVAYGTLGDLSGITPTFNATSVYVGTSQESELAEYVTGTVSARSGDVLSLTGATFLSPLGTTTFFNSLSPIDVGSGTIVSEDGVAAPNLTFGSISVGQQISVSGQEILNSAGTEVIGLDANAGQVRLQSTPLWGTLLSATANSATLALSWINNFTAYDSFIYTGTGPTGGPTTSSAYVVNTGSLDESSLAPGTLLQMNGFVTPFGSAPPNFTATSITPGSANLQQLVVEWTNGGPGNPFISVHPEGLVLDLANADLGIHYIRTGPMTVDLMSLPASPLITAVGADPSNLQLAVGSLSLSRGITVYNSPSAFAAGINSFLGGSSRFYRLVAYGQYDSATNTFVASRINVALQETTTTS